MGIEELRQKNNKKLEQEIKDAEIVNHALNLLPSVPVKHIFVPDHRGNVWIEIEVENRADTLPLMEVLKPVPTLIYKDSCTSIFPLKQLTDKQRERGTYFEIEPFYLWEAEYRYYRHGETTVEMWWFCEIEELTFKVKCPVKKDPARIWKKIERDQYERIISNKWQFDNFPSAEWLHFYSSNSDYPGSKVLYNVRNL